MGFLTLLESIPPTFLGIILGSLLTIIGVILTNSSNTRRLRLQHEHERSLENKSRDLNLRRDVYMEAMEAIATGLVAVSRFGDLNISADTLMHSYTDLSPKIGKVTIVGNNDTIKALATFNLELTGAFLRLSAKREKFNTLFHHSQAIEKELEQARQEQKHMAGLLKEAQAVQAGLTPDDRLQEESDAAARQVEELQAEYEDTWKQIFPIQIQLVKDSTTEVAVLDQLLVPLIGLMRAELELPFNEAYYAEILKSGHEKQREYLDAFFRDFDGKDSAEEEA